MPRAYNNSSDGLERNVHYDFKVGRLEYEDAGSLTGYIAHFNQAQGKPVPYLYIDNDSYGVDAVYDGYTNDSGLYENPNTFQLITYGLDGLPGNPGPWRTAGPAGEDNICNFAQGRLDRMSLGTTETTARN